MSDGRDYVAGYTTPDDSKESTISPPDGEVPNHPEWPEGWVPAACHPNLLRLHAPGELAYHRGRAYDSDFVGILGGKSIL